MSETNFSMTILGVPPYSARGITQSLEPIDHASGIYRTINGGLVNFSAPQFQKYKTTVNGNDQNPPAFDSIWPGQEVVMDCVAELSYPVGGSPNRTVVPGSARTESGFIIYRPRLTMTITKITAQNDEWGATVTWQLEAEES